MKKYIKSNQDSINWLSQQNLFDILKGYEGHCINKKTSWSGTVEVVHDNDYEFSIYYKGDKGCSDDLSKVYMHENSVVIYPNTGSICRCKSITEYKQALRSEFSGLIKD